ncbi:hypothetical protein SPRG_10539 [Saprolegnia parasitica CBS 223.65]|uniref:5'-Nucleotidase C-terminal domain-containing protein n=1 Tax=Saprolegnia parasitica (strain CBS 223.65) TaxID=695850 RepID=A0A067CAD4_SAPPC|nr:hypothetical protein SPRG_10539 [Saprolegnia parasitica CBS 223.65]KDO23762.1 hypothetical protein SPRG_10539 [Saprolegnia parasitica CBS 223.65]|eukprot:XP_012205577.1 hypothetical protein SPRG_10539 [Saprolegnia parasitica CBS 223.65]
MATLTILTVNDVYDVAPDAHGIGGMAELATLLQRERAATPASSTLLTTINGDFLSASRAGSYYKGAHMIDLLNHMDIDFAVFGNHEFDFGADVLAQRVQESKFRWFGSNVKERATGGLFANATDTLLLPIGQDGALKLGIFGICTPETPQLSFPGDRVVFEDLIETSQRCVDSLVAQGADVILALTHVSIAHDKLVARRVPRIDIIIGGHDHDPYTLYQGKTFIHKSGQNANWLGRLDFHIAKDGPKVLVTPEWKMLLNKGVAPDADITRLVQKYMARFSGDDDAENRPIAVLELPLDVQTVVVRGQESSFGNLVADAIRSELGAHVGHVSGGFLRSNTLHAAKTTLTARMIHTDMPIQGPAVLTRIRAGDLQEALLQQLGAYPALSGSFPHVSGVRLVYDSSTRTMTSFTDEAGNEIDLNAELTVATTQFIAGGGDGCVAWRKGLVVETHDIMANEVIRFVEKQRILAYAATEGRIVILD